MEHSATNDRDPGHISEYRQAEDLLRELEGSLADMQSGNMPENRLDEILQKYHELLRLWDHTFPLLMQDGPAFELDREPVNLYLLPRFNQDPERRWLLCIYPRTYDQAPKVQILFWEVKDDKVRLTQPPKHPEYILPRRDQSCPRLDPQLPQEIQERLQLNRVEPEEKIDDEQRWRPLDLRAKKLLVSDLGDTVAIRLEYAEGRLQIMADPVEGLTTVNWLLSPNLKLLRQKRRSTSAMETVLQLGRNTGDDWKDDRLLDRDGRCIQTRGVGIGRIRGVDGPEQARATGTGQALGNILYAGGSKAKVFRIDMDERRITAKSKLLRGAIHDLLIVDHPARPEGYAILTAASNGAIYLLDDGNGAADATSIEIIHYQELGRPIIHLMGRGDSHILARDQHAKLIPLRIADPALQQSLSERMAAELHYKLDADNRLLEYSGDVDTLNKCPASISQWTPLASLALQYHLHPRHEDGAFDSADFALFCHHLHDNYGNLEGESLRQWALLHLELLEQLWRLMRNDCMQERKSGNCGRFPANDAQLEFLWPLLKPHGRAPDWLLMRMLRDADRLELWLKHKGLNGASVTKNVDEIRTLINRTRQRLLACSHDLRGITVRATWRLRGQVKHLRVIDQEQHLIAFIEIGFGLKVMQLDPINGSYKPLVERPTENGFWNGLVTTLMAGPMLERAVDGDAERPRHLFLATDEGDLRLFRLGLSGTGAELHERWKRDDRMEVRSCRPLVLGKQKGLLLGGCNENGAPRLALLKLPARKKEKPLPLWTGRGVGVLRKLVYDHETGSLWAIDREQGVLHHWRLSDELFLPQRERGPAMDTPDTWLNVPSHLHTLQMGGNNRDLLICGGHDGRVYALDRRSGELRWTVGCGKSIKRTDYLSKANLTNDASGVWLLGGEFRDVVVVDDTGTVHTIIEEVGPLSSVYAYPHGSQILLCGLDGRIIFFEASAPFDCPPLENEANLYDWLHPMRVADRERCDGTKLAKCLEDYYPTKPNFGGDRMPREMLPVTVLIEQAFQSLVRPDLTPIPSDRLERFALREEPQRLGWLLRRVLQKIDGPAPIDCLPAVQTALELCEALWRELDNLKLDTEICHLIGQILIFLETLRVGRHACPPTPPLEMPDATYDRLRSLLFDINRCLWWSLDTEDCAKGLIKENLRRDLQLSQVTRNWAHLRNQGSIGQRLACLCENLHVLWHPDPIAPIGWRISGVIKDGLPMTSLQEREWQEWMIGVAQTSPRYASEELDPGSGDKRDKKGQDGDKKFQAPPPLALLENAQLQPIDAADIGALKAVWGDNEPWRRWIDRLANLLNELDQARLSHSPPLAWKRWQLMVELLSHFAEAGQSQFTSANGYTLLEFWWPRLTRQWRTAIEEARKALIADFNDKPVRYIEIEGIVDIWLDSRTVELRLTLANHGPNDLRIDRIEGDGFKRAKENAPLELKTGSSGAVHTVEFHTDTEDRIDGTLSLSCFNLFSGERVVRHEVIHRGRGLDRFTADEQWQATWGRLGQLLPELGTDLIWIDGNSLPNNERSRLKKLVRDQFKIDVDEELSVYPFLGPACLDESHLFSPDLALGAPAGRLVEQVHALLHGDGDRTVNYIALAIWLYRRDEDSSPAPRTVVEALDDQLPTQGQIDMLLHALLDGCATSGALERFIDGLSALPRQAMGAWIRGDPLYQDPDVDIGSATLKERYAAPATLLGASVWRTLDEAGVTDSEMAQWLGMDEATIRRQRGVHPALAGLFSDRDGAASPESNQEVAESLLTSLGASLVSELEPRVFFTELQIDLLHNRFFRCYVLPPRASVGERARLKDARPGVWLCPDLNAPPSDLPGEAVTVDQDQCLALLHACDPEDARTILNRAAATQIEIVPSKVFRTSDGMGYRVADHFWGRKDELAEARQAILDSDREAHALLIIGGRRMGKTSFRERLIYESTDGGQAGDRGRIFVLVDLQGYPPDTQMTQAGSEFRFFKFLYKSLEKVKYPFPFSQQWDESQKDSREQRNKVRDHLKSHLEFIKERTGHTPVLILDETEEFAQIDALHDFQIMKFLRELIYGNHICLVATSYPHGKGHRYALHNLKKDTGGPYYNTLTVTVYMTRWAQEDAWSYLRSKLSGFGIGLPLHLREEVLRITRGIPWVVHLLGKEICRMSGESRPHRLISITQWRQIRVNAIAIIREQVKTTVDERAEELDRKAMVQFSRNPENRFSGGRLWGALCKIAERYEPPATWDPGEGRRPVGKQLCSFDVDTLFQSFEGKIPRERIHAVLNRLTASTVLEGDYQDPNIFYFANDLLPMVAREPRETNQ